MNRTYFKNLLIQGVPGIIGFSYLDAADYQFISACEIRQIQIRIGPDVKNGAFSLCYFRDCIILMHPDSIGRSAFSNCIFDEECTFVEDEGATEK